MIDDVSSPNYGLAVVGGASISLLYYLPIVSDFFHGFEKAMFQLFPVVGPYIRISNLLLFAVGYLIAHQRTDIPVIDLLLIPIAIVLGLAVVNTIGVIVNELINPTRRVTGAPSITSQIADLLRVSFTVSLVPCYLGVLAGNSSSIISGERSQPAADGTATTVGETNTESQAQLMGKIGSRDGDLSLDGTLTLRNHSSEPVEILFRAKTEQRLLVKQKETLNVGDTAEWTELPPAHPFKVDLKTSTGQRDSLLVENRGANATDVIVTVSDGNISMVAK